MNVLLYSEGCIRENTIVLKIKEDLNNKGYNTRCKISEADLIVFVTCAGTCRTMEECFKWINIFLSAKKTETKMIITGCLADKTIFKNYLEHDDVIIMESNNFYVPVENYIFDENKKDSLKKRLSYSTKFWYGNQALVQFMLEEGCTNNCSFCKHNYIDGGVCSIPYDAALNHLKGLIKTGTKKIILSGENLALYGIDLEGKQILHRFIHELSLEEGLIYIDVNEIAPQNMYPELLEELENNPKVVKVCMQLETASPRLLQLMNRNHTIEQYEYIAKRLRNKGKFVDTVLMSAFPTESYDDLDYTAKFLDENNILCTLISEYSDFDAIPSSKFEQLPYLEKKKHTRYLIEKMKETNRRILLDEVDNIDKSIICDNDNGVIIINFASGYSYRKEYNDAPVGTIITDKPRMLTRDGRFNYLYRY
ncbi:MAG: radical SAM protein [Erysipelotrichales bacterium]|nr:radical SAM protein [Erysipelotrichales bacterium]